MSAPDAGGVVLFPKKWVEFESEGLGYVFRPRDTDVMIHVTRLTRRQGDLYGRLDVTCEIPGLPHHLLRQQHKFEGSASNRELAKALQEATRGLDGLPWPTLIQRLTRYVIDADESDGMDEDLCPPLDDTEPAWCVQNVLLHGSVNVIYGPGGAGKGWLATALGIAIQTGTPFIGLSTMRGNVMYLDWEDSREILEKRIAKVCKGWALPFTPLTKYHRYTKRFSDVIGSVAHSCDEHKIDVVIVDSVGAAMGAAGEHSNYEDTALRMAACCRALGNRTLILIDHVNSDGKRSDGLAGKQYGSIYKQNYARNCLEIKADQERGALRTDLAMYQTKTNHTALLAPLGVRLDFSNPGAVRLTRIDARESVVLAKPLSLRYRIDGELAKGAQTYMQLHAAFPDQEAKTIDKTVQRGVRDGRYVEVIGSSPKQFGLVVAR